MTTRKGIMLCTPMDERRIEKWFSQGDPYVWTQPKLDGLRCRAIPLPKNGRLLVSSQENFFYSVPHIQKALQEATTFLGDLELDGELYNHHMNFEQLCSIVKRETTLHPRHEEIEFHIFDHCDETTDQTSRLERILNLEKYLPPDSPLRIVLCNLCESFEEIMQDYQRYLLDGYEGIIVRRWSTPYVRKRSTEVLKFKPKQQDTYKVVGYEEEISINGEPKNALGALVCEKHNHRFNVGTGFTQDQRQHLWTQREKLPGSYVVVNYQHITSKNQVPRFPVFNEIHW